MKIPLDMGFKGNRTYLHGTSFFNALEQVSQAFTGEPDVFVARLVFRRLARYICEVSSSLPDTNDSLAGQGRYRLSSGTVKDFWLIETTKPVVDRQPYDEDALFADAVIDLDGRVAQLTKRSINTPIEDVVGLTKVLNYRLMPDISGKWLFGQLDLNAPLREGYHRIDIRMQSAFAGRFSVSEIYLDDNNVGAIRFIVGEP
jgi:hypothetical protein